MSFPAMAGPFGISSDRFAYDGTISVFDTLDDARNGVNARSGPHDIPSITDQSGTFGGRDLGLFISQGAPTNLFSNDFNIMLTAWYYTQTGPSQGSGNPNNTNTGFFQLYDLDSSTETSASGSWDSSLTTFNMSITGENATRTDDFGRLWHAPNTSGPGAQTGGTFIEYSMVLTANFENAATEDPTNPQWFSIAEDPTSATGQLTGIFENQCSLSANCTDPSVEGFYVFDFEINLDSWVFANQDTLLTDNGFIPYSASYFGAAVSVPEPSAFVLLGIGLVGISVARARRSRKIAV